MYCKIKQACIKLVIVEDYTKMHSQQNIKIWITNVFTVAHHLFISWARLIQSIPHVIFFKIHCNIILQTLPRCSKWTVQGFWLKLCMHCWSLPCVLHAPPTHPSDPPWIDHHSNIWWEVQTLETPHNEFLSSLLLLLPS